MMFKKASLGIENFVNDLSLWFIRRSRDRVGPSAEDEKDKIIITKLYILFWLIFLKHLLLLCLLFLKKFIAI